MNTDNKLLDFIEGIKMIHFSNPSDAMADLPELDYYKYRLGELRQEARQIIKDHNETENIKTKALESMRFWIYHWKRDSEAGLKPTENSLSLALVEIEKALNP